MTALVIIDDKSSNNINKTSVAQVEIDSNVVLDNTQGKLGMAD